MPMECVLSQHSLLRRRRLSQIRTGTGLVMETGKCLPAMIGIPPQETFLEGRRNDVLRHSVGLQVTRTVESITYI